MDQLPKEIILCIAERLPACDLKSLILTKKLFQTSIACHNKSIAKNSVNNLYPHHPKRLLSSRSVARRAIEAESLHGLAELERRQKRADAALKAQFEQNGNPSITWGNEQNTSIPRPPHTRRYGQSDHEEGLDLFERALSHCDAMADLAVAPRDGEATADSFDALTQGRCLRPAQIRYIHSLPFHELQILQVTGQFNYDGFQELLKREIDETEIDWVVKNNLACSALMQELVLRHGSWFLWLGTEAAIKSDKHTVDTFVNLVGDAMREIERWEMGEPDVPDGLITTIAIRYRELCAQYEEAESQYEDGDEFESEKRGWIADEQGQQPNQALVVS